MTKLNMEPCYCGYAGESQPQSASKMFQSLAIIWKSIILKNNIKLLDVMKDCIIRVQRRVGNQAQPADQYLIPDVSLGRRPPWGFSTDVDENHLGDNCYFFVIDLKASL
uniref:uncharacterized protein LOC117695757 isoform X8 n=1 Tax=Arvicanthis niloticus TaxID=61156 RepID=UPI00402B410D